MNKENVLDILLGEALERLDRAAGKVREIPELDENTNNKNLGRAIVEIWEVRERMYQHWPELKLSFVSEIEEDENRYYTLASLLAEGLKHEKAGNLKEAESAYQNVRKVSSYGYFKMQAEAGLYRLIEKKGS